MLISHRKRFLFIQNPKTASTSVEAVLDPYSKKLTQKMIDSVSNPPEGWRPEPRPKHGGLYTASVVFGPSVLDEYYIFSVVRHPVDYLLSWFYFRKRAEIADPLHRAHKNYLGDMCLDEYLRQIENGERKRPDSITRRLRVPESDGLVDTRVKLCRYESLEEDLKACCKEIGIRMRKLPRKNVSEQRRKLRAGDLDDYTCQRIMDIYQEEARVLGYE